MRDIRNNDLKKQMFDIEDRGNVSYYLGINFERQYNGIIKLLKPQIIDKIIRDVGIEKHQSRPTPAPSTKILHQDLEGKLSKGYFGYRSVVGNINFIKKGFRPDIAYAIHQCARFSIDPRESHGDAIRYIAKYIKGERYKGIMMNPRMYKSFEVYVNASFSGEWIKKSAAHNPVTSKSR